MDTKQALFILFVVAATVATCMCASECEYYTRRRNELLSSGTTCNWKLDVQSDQCSSIIAAGKQNDVLQRRTDGRLVQPEGQGICGSCWAFSSTHAYADRLRLASTGDDTILSAEDLATCALPDANGCCGGQLTDGVEFFEQEGAITRDCKPYTLENTNIDCDSEPVPPLTCASSCSNGNVFNRADFLLPSYDNVIGEANIIQALQNGPVVVGMWPFPQEFFLYRCGIFCQSSGSFCLESGHAVEIVDYGTEDEIDYWVVKNSWGDDWGEEGYFRIRRSQFYFRINEPGTFAPLIGDNNGPSEAFQSRAVCAPETVDPSTIPDDLMMGIANFAVANAECSESTDTASDSVTVESVMKATIQIVDGSLFNLVIDANIEGCSDESIITAEVYITPNGTQELMEYEYRASAHAITAGLGLLVVICIMSLACFL